MKYALTIAGHDPSGGAGLTADLKTFEAHSVYGFSVCTAITVQNDRDFRQIEWIEKELIFEQISILMEQFEIGFVKIGIIQNFELLDAVIDYLISKIPSVRIVWDPVLKASAGFEIHTNPNLDLLWNIVEKCYLVTPNKPEWDFLFSSLTENADKSGDWNMLVKGGHDTGDKALDLLYQSGFILPISSPRLEGEKHGTGCVLSSAITANLVLGKTLESACYEAKKYISRFILSNDSLLGQHEYA